MHLLSLELFARLILFSRRRVIPKRKRSYLEKKERVVASEDLKDHTGITKDTILLGLGSYIPVFM